MNTHPTIQEQTVELYEDNAGGLYLRRGGATYAGMEAAGSCFEADARALAQGDTDQWTVEQLRPSPSEGAPCSSCRDGWATYPPSALRAACEEGLHDLDGAWAAGHLGSPDNYEPLASLPRGASAREVVAAVRAATRAAWLDHALAECELVATWRGGVVEVAGRPGLAATRYLDRACPPLGGTA